ncbi:type II secretion system F family protein [Parageobacillus thermoglucosidasius]|uniref:Type II secretion system F family protein n=1 Tax=Parageobacillus thermoglucosidasius TaxID=1426 RepID=A0AB38R5W1_PARTM|nr:type II secretion system F family protein [Parageobacillus thermoglucosidasius]UOE78377.1 type II secretion system F family protein [Parageobacillus thermoglucosidasius]
MYSLLAYLSLAITFVSVYFLAKTLNKREKSLFLEFVQSGKKKEKTKNESKLSKLSLFLPNQVIKEAKKYEYHLTAVNYWLMSIGSGLCISVIFYILLGRNPIAYALFLLGFGVPVLRVYAYKKKYREILIDRIAIYMKSFASGLSAVNNPVKVLEEVSPIMSPDIQEEIEKAIKYLQNGATVTKAFESMNERYDFKQLKFFHELLEVAHLEGGGNFEELKDTVEDFEFQKVLSSELKTALAQAKRAFIQNAIIAVFFIPFVILGALFIKVPSAYDIVATHPLSRAAIIINVILVTFVAIKVEKISNYNPVERR